MNVNLAGWYTVMAYMDAVLQNWFGNSPETVSATRGAIQSAFAPIGLSPASSRTSVANGLRFPNACTQVRKDGPPALHTTRSQAETEKQTGRSCKEHRGRKNTGKQWVRNSQGPFQCQECSKGFKSLSSIRLHRRTHGPKRYKCTKAGCAKKYTRPADCKRHVESVSHHSWPSYPTRAFGSDQGASFTRGGHITAPCVM